MAVRELLASATPLSDKQRDRVQRGWLTLGGRGGRRREVERQGKTEEQTDVPLNSMPKLIIESKSRASN